MTTIQVGSNLDKEVWFVMQHYFYSDLAFGFNTEMYV